MSEKIIKIVLSILFFACLADLSYGYYQFVRFAALVGFAFLAYQANERQNKIEVIIFVCLAILFQPFFKIALGRQIWNIVDIIIGVLLLLSIWIKPKSQH